MQHLVERATANVEILTSALANHSVVPVEIFGADNAVVGGRNVVTLLNQQNFEGVSDLVVDLSALSVGTSFPIVRYLVERIERGKGLPNLHLFVAHDPALDGAIQSTPSDAPGYVHGFRGGSTLDGAAAAAKLWLPQLASGRGGALGRLHTFVDPHDTCPILPFPAADPRLGDRLVEEFLTEFESGWSVDTRNVVYADESDPLDLYRTILRLDDLRKPVFREVGGSLLVLSPLGSKVTALGALMAALERDLPVAYLELIGYSLDGSVARQAKTRTSYIFGWKGTCIRSLDRRCITKGRRKMSTVVKKPRAFGVGLIALDLVMGADPESPVRSWAGGTCGNVLSILPTSVGTRFRSRE